MGRLSPPTESLRRSLLFRLAALEESLEGLSKQSAAGREGVKAALELFCRYPEWVRRYARREVGNSVRDRTLATLLGEASVDVVDKADFVEQWFATGTSKDVPLALATAVERECSTLGMEETRAVLAVGRADNFRAYPDDLREFLFRGKKINYPEPSGSRRRFALIQVPRLEGGAGLWWPLTVGHEVAHLKLKPSEVAKLDLATRMKWSRLKVSRGKRAAFLTIATNWATEMICDAYCTRRFGPAGVAALVEFLEQGGATSLYRISHPPGWLRFSLMRSWLGDVGDSETRVILQHCDAIVARSCPDCPENPSLARLAEFMLSLGQRIWDTAAGWGVDQFLVAEREGEIRRGVADLRRGVPPQPMANADVASDMRDADAINAAWIAWVTKSKLPISSLLTKCLDDLAFVRLWTSNGGELGSARPPTSPRDDVTLATPAQESGVLSGSSVADRLESPPGDARHITLTPALHQVIGHGSVDLRLGKHFIVFHRSGTAAIRTFHPRWDGREVQRRVEIGWGEDFVLHPGELALAGTLEYIALPSDLAAQVITRSSYGRLGMITATAVQVHPNFRGCLTLELVNLGNVPLRMTPGERIAQLVFFVVRPRAGDREKTDTSCPTGPEFSRPYGRSAGDRVLAKLLSATRGRVERS